MGNETTKGFLRTLKQDNKNEENVEPRKAFVESPEEESINKSSMPPELASIFRTPEKKESLKLKGIHFKPKQIEKIEEFSKKAGKSHSEFVRDVIDFAIEQIEKNGY